VKTVKKRIFGISIRPREILSLLLFIALAVVFEYVEGNLALGGVRPSADNFPSMISNFDVRTFLLINNGLANPYLNWFFNIITRLGSTDPILIASIALYVAGRRREGVLLFASIIMGTLITLPVKLAISRPRPFATLPGAIAFEAEGGSSFPSGHAMRAFASAYVLSYLWPKLKAPFYLLACLVGFSRIYLGQHYPFDVLAGASIGPIVGYLTIRFENRILKVASRFGISTTRPS
jgi:undecaprenyl-diphosphatase